MFRKAITLESEGKLNVGLMMKEIMSDPDMKSIAKQVSQYVGKLPGEVKKLNENDKKRYTVDIDSKNYLVNALGYLKKTFSCEIEIYSADDKDIYDPANKSRFAIPLRPAIYIE
jgi:leucyl-tRNA synthetase